MNPINTNAIRLALVALLLSLPVRGSDWLTYLAPAQAKAKAENKAVLLDFTGSDWCGWCVRLKKEVFTQPEFEKFANENLVLVEVDFPHHAAQSPAQRQANQALAQQYGIEGYPTIIVLNSQGLKIGSLGYEPGGPKNYIERLKGIMGNKQGVAVPPAPSAAPGNPEPPLFGGASVSTSANYAEPTLKGISGPKNKRLAMINDQTFGVGEAGIIKCGDKRQKIRCLEIRDTAVVILLADTNERKELRLRTVSH